MKKRLAYAALALGLGLGCIGGGFALSGFTRRCAGPVVAALLLLLAVLAGAFAGSRRRMRRANAELEKALAAAKAANEAKTTFLSSMSHDIRTPMNAIEGMTTIAKKHIDEPERVSDCLDKISLSSHHLLTLINDVLDISKIESGKMVLTPAAFSVRDVVTTLVNVTRPQIQAKMLSFYVQIHGMEHEIVLGDEVRVSQIFVNILSNAVKYTPERGRIILNLAEETLPGGESVRLVYSVADTGIGMSPEFMETMYETFSRAPDARIDQIQGSGLGLSIVKRMVDMMGGTIRCESREGRGTTFTVTLDLPIGAPPAAYKPAGDASDGNDLKGLHLLIAEDNELNWEVIRELLCMYGITADWAQNGKECVDMLESAGSPAYDLVLMDIQMPLMDGWEAARIIRADERPHIRTIPIIAMTADAFAEDIAASYAAGMDGHVSKPVDLDELFQEIRKAVRARRA